MKPNSAIVAKWQMRKTDDINVKNFVEVEIKLLPHLELPR